MTSGQIQLKIGFCVDDREIVAEFSYEALNDEKLFLNSAPPGFALTPTPRAFAHLRQHLMRSIVHAEWEAIVATTGWYIWDGQYVFVNGEGVIRSDTPRIPYSDEGATGTSQLQNLIDVDRACSDVPILVKEKPKITKVTLVKSEQLSRYRLLTSETPEEARDAVKRVLDLLSVGDALVTYIAIPLLFLAAIRDPRFVLFLYGQTGSLKTVFSLLLLSFFVPGAKEADGASFKSTENAIRARFFGSGNVAVVIDDFIQIPGSRGVGEEAKKAENLIRSIVNGTGKERSFSDGSLRPHDKPRGLAIITGEQLPDGLDSLKHRMVALEIDEKTFETAIAGPRPNLMDTFQDDAESGVFAQAMGDFLKWAAPQLEQLHAMFELDPKEMEDISDVHPRLVDAVRDILVGAKFLLFYALSIGACDLEDFDHHYKKTVNACLDLVGRATLEALDSKPTEAFRHLIQAALASHQCYIEIENMEFYLENKDCIPPELLGYTSHEICIESKDRTSEDSDTDVEYTTKTIYKPHGKRIGTIPLISMKE
ncbi:hypothetical protein SH661x_002764 [Planctomicrobium sp. SH661]|uniref:hypothetical protein n=1 Tax=Planctomicrobium sp. SH661 TaxID=3448124 RepID=UPI003F5C7F0F